MTPHAPAEVEWPVMFALRRYHSKGQNSVTRLLHYWADVSRAWGFRVRAFQAAAISTQRF